MQGIQLLVPIALLYWSRSPDKRDLIPPAAKTLTKLNKKCIGLTNIDRFMLELTETFM